MLGVVIEEGFTEMSGRRRGATGRGWKHSSVAALATLGCCLLSAPVANADFDDLLDVVLGAATAGPDLGDLGGIPGDLGAFDVHDFLQDPLAQLDQAFHDSPGQFGLGEPDSGSADASHDPGTAPDTTPDTTPDQGSGTTPDHGSGSDSEHDSSGGNSSNSPSLPKFSMPSGGNGGGGNGGGSGGGPGGSGGSGNGATKARANTSVTKDTLILAPAP